MRKGIWSMTTGLSGLKSKFATEFTIKANSHSFINTEFGKTERRYKVHKKLQTFLVIVGKSTLLSRRSLNI